MVALVSQEWCYASCYSVDHMVALHEEGVLTRWGLKTQSLDLVFTWDLTQDFLVLSLQNNNVVPALYLTPDLAR